MTAFFLLFAAAQAQTPAHWPRLRASSATCSGMPLAPGASISFDEKFPNSIPLKFKVTHQGNGHYQLGLNISFRNSDEAIKKQMLASLRSCVQSANPGLRGPNNQSLEILLDSSAPLHEVDIHAGGRASVEAWSPDMPCATMVHEMLHLTGLADEYNERDVVRNNQVVANFNCRHVGNPASIMSINTLAWSRWINDGASLLMPFQFNYIVNGGCASANLPYLRCSTTAYLTRAQCPDANLEQMCSQVLDARSSDQEILNRFLDPQAVFPMDEISITSAAQIPASVAGERILAEAKLALSQHAGKRFLTLLMYFDRHYGELSEEQREEIRKLYQESLSWSRLRANAAWFTLVKN